VSYKGDKVQANWHFDKELARAVYPIAIKVVAYQIGSGVEPKVKGAKAVEQTLLIEKP
jgi:hypothetical protein